MSDPPDAWLIALSAELSEGREVDWDAAARAAGNDDTAGLIGELRRLSSVIDAYRRLPGASPAPDGEPPDVAVASHWQHLVVLDRVGAGAFGTVFRAWDTHLDREVALKFIPSRGAPHRSPLDEARLLARVRHPNVVTVYGADADADRVAIWMELVEGETLAEMVRLRGPMSAREAAEIGSEVCRAVCALHAADLLHQDIKAHNVMREVGGRIVLMDLSGAQALDSEPFATAVAGTPPYMAPELFAGHPATFASDVYSLGVLLFYLLSGQHPVEGGSLESIGQAHQREARRRLRDLRPELPAPIVQIVERATAVDPSARYQTAGELEHALAVMLGRHGSASDDSDRDGRPHLAPAGRRWPWYGVAALAGVCVLVVLVMILGLGHGAPPEAPVVRLAVGPPYNTGGWPRVSPDGRMVVFGGLQENRNVLWVRALDDAEPRPLTGTAADESAFWSPDSRFIAFFDDRKLKTIAARGGSVQRLAEAPEPAGGDWRGDVILFASRGEIYRVAADGTGLSRVTTLEAAQGDYQHAWPEWLPDGRRFLFVLRSRNPDRSGIYLTSLDAPAPRRIMPAFSRAVYANGQLVFVRDGVLMAQAFDAASETLVGSPVVLAPSVKFHPASDAAYDVSDAGVLVYRALEALPATQLLQFDRRGRQIATLSARSFYRHPRLSPDGRRLAVERIETGRNNVDLWLIDLARHMETRFTADDAPDVHPEWSPDGRQIAFASKRGPRFDIYVKTVDGTDQERVVLASNLDKFPEQWSPDGRLLLGSLARGGLWVLPLTGPPRWTPIRHAGVGGPGPAEFSADGRWMAYASAESGRSDVYVEPYPATGRRWQISPDGGAEPHWRRDGKELFYIGPTGELMAVAIATGADLRADTPIRLFNMAIPELAGASDYAASADGRTFVVNTILSDPAIPPIQVIVNWVSLLRR